MCLLQRSPKLLDPGPKSRFYQRPWAELNAVTSNGKGSCNLIIVDAYVYLSLLFRKVKTSQTNDLGKQIIFISHTSNFVVEILIKAKS